MKKHYLIILLIAVAAFNTAKAQYVTIPDTAFVSWLKGHGYATCFSGNQLDTANSLVLNAVSMYCSARPIRDLTGIQYFKGLDSLDCSNDSLYYIPAWPQHLVFINCEYNNLDSIPPVPSTLTGLECANNNLTAITMSPVLTYAEFSFNKVRALPPLPSTLKVLSFSYDSVTALPDTFPNLGILTFGNNQVRGPLVGLPLNSLGILDCSQNQITSLSTLPIYLSSLFCEFNPMTSPLPALPSVYLDQVDCRADNLTVLPALPATLLDLSCGYNYSLTSLPVLPAGMQNLSTDFDPLDSLPVLPPGLLTLYVQYGHLTTLPILPASLNTLDCQYNQLTSIPSLPDTMHYFRCSGNANLYCLPELKVIDQFYFQNTGITCLPDYGTITTSLPDLDTVPLCGIFNPGGCEPFWNISGLIYYDANSNCIYDSNDAGEEYVKVQLTSGGFQQQVYSSFGGGYSFLADQNINYTITIDTTSVPFVISCPSSNSIAAVVTPADSMSYYNNFALKCRPDGVDVGVQSIINSNWIAPRPSTPFVLYTTAGDISALFGAHCAAGDSGQVQLIYNGEITYKGMATGALQPVITGDTLTWNIADFGAVNDYTAFNANFAVDTFATAGTQACFTVRVTTNAYDYNPANNTGYFCFTIIDALDPNEKEVSPAGNIDTSNHWLTYTIRFQNTGTAAAQNVHINDTLDSNLDPSTFQLTAFSAKNLTQLFNNVVVFNFPNINLPDSLTSDSASKGYVQYKIKLKDNLPWGTQINNTASIYFDYNSAVVTNTTRSFYGDSLTGINNLYNQSAEVTLYPNPAKSYTTINVSNNLIGSWLELSDAVGRVILRQQINSSRFVLPTGGLSNGIYMVKVSEEGVGEVVKKLVVE